MLALLYKLSGEYRATCLAARQAGYELHRTHGKWLLLAKHEGADLFNGTTVRAEFDTLNQVEYYVRYQPAYA